MEPPSARPDPARPAPGRKPLDRVRGVLSVLGILLHCLLFEVWLQLGLLRSRRSEARRVALMNQGVRLWGITGWWLIRNGLGLRVTVEGVPPAEGRYLVVSNHQSSVDCTLLLSVLRSLNLKFVAKEELRRRKPAVSTGLHHGGSVFVGKEDLGRDLEALERFGARMERFCGSPHVFPEGWRTRDGNLLPFHWGGVEAVRRASGLPILPVTCDGLWRAFTIFELWRIVRGTVRVRIAEPVPTEDVARDPRSAYRRIEETIRRDLGRFRSGGEEEPPQEGAVRTSGA